MRVGYGKEDTRGGLRTSQEIIQASTSGWTDGQGYGYVGMSSSRDVWTERYEVDEVLRLS
jgi:hypothetical protein